MPIGHISELKRIPLHRFAVSEHSEEYHPPEYIREYRALSRIVLLDGRETPFYFGKRRSFSRVTFEIDGIWCYVDHSYGELVNLNDLLWDLASPCEFAADQALTQYVREQKVLAGR